MRRQEVVKIIILAFLILIFLNTPPILDSAKNIEVALGIKSRVFFEDGIAAYLGSPSQTYMDTHPPLTGLLITLFKPFRDFRIFYLFSLVLYLLTFALVLRTYGEAPLTFAVFLSPAVIVLVNSYMNDHFTFMFTAAALAFLHLYLKYERTVYKYLSVFFMALAAFTSYSAALFCLIPLIEIYLKEKKFESVFLLPPIMILCYLLIVYFITGRFIFLDLLQWTPPGIHLPKLFLLEKLFYAAVALGFLLLPVALLYEKSGRRILTVLVIATVIAAIAGPSIYTVAGTITALIGSFLILKNTEKRMAFYTAGIFLVIALIYPQPTPRNFVILLPLVIIGGKKTGKTPIPLYAFMIFFSVLFLYGIYDHASTEAVLSKRMLGSCENPKTVSNGTLRYYARKMEFTPLPRKWNEWRSLVCEGYSEAVFDNLEEGNVLLSNLDLEEYFYSNRNITLEKTAQCNSGPVDVFSNGSLFFLKRKYPLPVYFGRAPVFVSKYRVGDFKTTVSEEPEVKTVKRFKNFIFEGYSVSENKICKVDAFIRFKKYIPILAFLHAGEGSALFQTHKLISKNMLDRNGRVKISLELDTPPGNTLFLILTNPALKPFKLGNTDHRLKMISGNNGGE